MILCRGREGDPTIPADYFWMHRPIVYDETEGGCPMCRVYEAILVGAVLVNDARRDGVLGLQAVANHVEAMSREYNLSVGEYEEVRSRVAPTETLNWGVLPDEAQPENTFVDHMFDDVEEKPWVDEIPFRPTPPVSRMDLLMGGDKPPTPTRRRRKKT